jgi:hypothetical protein
MDIEKHKGTLVRSLRTLETEIARLVEALSHEPVWIELQEQGGSESPVRRACEALAAIDYATHDDDEQSVVCVGAIGVTPDIMKKIKIVNAAKLEFKTVCTFLHRIQIRVPLKGGSSTTPIPLTRVLLRSIQRSNLNLLSAYRKIPVLDAPPSTITYTVARTRAVYRKKIGQIEDMLTERGHPNAARDRNKLAELPPHETHLALAKERYVNLRANVRYARLDPRGRGRAQFAAELPLTFVMRSKDPAPAVNFPAATADKPASPRHRQRIIEDAPFLDSLPVYRYITHTVTGLDAQSPRRGR